MRGVTRSFWALAAILGVLEGYLVYLAVSSLHRVLPCWWGFIPHPTNSLASCGERVAIFGSNSWVPAAVILVIFFATIGLAVSTLGSQVIRTRLAIRHLSVSASKPAHLIEAESRLGIDVTLADDPRCFCFCAGSIRPKVMISRGMADKLDVDEIAAVLAHEMGHAKRRDPARAIAVRVASRALFYVPLARHLADKALVAAELGADSFAVAAAGRDALVNALLSVLGEVRPALGSATEMASLDSLGIRIEALRTKQLPRVRPTFLVAAVSFIALVLMWSLSTWLPSSPSGVVIVHSSIASSSMVFPLI